MYDHEDDARRGKKRRRGRRGIYKGL